MILVRNLIGAIKQVALDVYTESTPTAVMFGTVLGVSPLRVNVDQRMTIELSNLIITASYADKVVTGDQVILLRNQGGQQFIILDKVG